jgi:hypothetical protein
MPLHRSLIFWCGALVLAFLVWVWADSLKAYSVVVVNWRGAGGELQLDLGSGAVGISTGTIDPGLKKLYFHARMEGASETDFDLWQASLTHGFNGRIHGVRVPLRLVFFVFLPVWLGMSVWRARRIASGRRAGMT